jgi:hypothetical protein
MHDIDLTVVDALRFVKVSITHDWPSGLEPAGNGYLTGASCAMLVLELRRGGYEIVKSTNG